MSSSDTPTDTPQTPARKSWMRRYLAIPTLAAIALVVYMVFFGEHSISRKIEYQAQIDSLQECLRVQGDSLAYYKDLNWRISTDPELMEQVVREQYNMNRPNEDVFIIR